VENLFHFGADCSCNVCELPGFRLIGLSLCDFLFRHAAARNVSNAGSGTDIS
jgi:hypothetical protein